jgi:uncharacterized membrane protein
MTVSAESQKTIDAYLAALRRHLRELMEADANDIVEEIRAHILDKTAAKAPDETAAAPETPDTFPDSVSATLAALGTPEELASRYRTEELLKRAQLAASPCATMLRRTALGLVTLVVCLVSAVGYCLGGGLFLIGVLKIFNPHNTGIWGARYPDGTSSLGFGSGSQPGKGHELLGWCLIPIGLLLGGGLLYLTFRFCNWSLRKFWRPRAWRQA